MNRLTVTSFSILLIAISAWSFRDPTDTYQWLLASTPIFNIVRILLAITLVIYVFVPALWDTYARHMLGILGGSLLVAGILGVVSPNYFGTLAFSIQPLDTMTFLEGGILALLASLQTIYREETVHQPTFDFGRTVQSVSMEVTPELSGHKTPHTV